MEASAHVAEQHRILVVDDEPNIADVVSMALRFQGFAVDTASTGRDALAAVRSFDPHLLVLASCCPTWRARRRRAPRRAAGTAADHLPRRASRTSRVRMGVLVKNLLALARLDEVREQHREPVDLTALAADAVDDAQVVAPERTIELHENGSARPVVVDGHRSQLRQVLANLMRNALVHTPAGRRWTAASPPNRDAGDVDDLGADEFGNAL